MWRVYLTNFWLMLVTMLALPFLLIFFRHGGNTSFWMYVYAVVAQRISGIRIEVLGRENILKTPAVYVLNHQSSLDGIPLGVLRIPRLAIIGKKEVAYLPFIGWAFYLAGNVLINRGDGRKAKGQLEAGVDAIKKRKVSIAIFPEGTRHRQGGDAGEGGFLPFKKGGFQLAIDAQAPIVPVVVEAFDHVYNKRTKTVKRGTVRVAVLPAVTTVRLTHKDSQKLLETVQGKMAAVYSAFRTNAKNRS